MWRVRRKVGSCYFLFSFLYYNKYQILAQQKQRRSLYQQSSFIIPNNPFQAKTLPLDIIMIKQYDFLFKVVLVGNSSVGKSSLLRRFTEQTFQQSYLATIGVDFRFKSITHNNQVVKFQIWDTAGQQRFRTITGTYYKGAHGIIVVYDITKQQSFEQLWSYWFKQIDKNAIPNVQLILLGNKSDLSENRQVKMQEVEQAITSRGIRHLEVSAKTGDQVAKAFQEMAEMLIKIYPKQEHKNEPMAVVEDIRKKRKEFQLQAAQTQPKNNTNKCC